MATKNDKKATLSTNETLKEVLSVLGSEKAKQAILSSGLVAADRDEGREEMGGPSFDDMPSDEEVARSMGSAEGDGDDGGDSPEINGDEGASLDNLAEDPEGGEDLPPEGAPVDEPPAEEPAPDKKTAVGPYDLAFHLRKVSSAFTQVANEADQLKKQTEGITSNMSSEQQAQWIEQRRFFIETAKEAEQKWVEFKKVLLDFSLAPKF